jgi:hypothetical protein
VTVIQIDNVTLSCKNVKGFCRTSVVEYLLVAMKNMDRKRKQTRANTQVCRDCKGTGLDKASHYRFTTGGHDDRSCKRCNGEGYIDIEIDLDIQHGSRKRL